MTRSEAISLIKSAQLMLINPATNEPVSDLYEALKMAISALEIECEWAKMTYDTNSIENKIMFEFSDGTKKRVTYTEEIKRTTVGE